MVIHHIDMVILDIGMGYGLMIWEMTVSIWSSPALIWDILSLWTCGVLRPCGGDDPLCLVYSCVNDPRAPPSVDVLYALKLLDEVGRCRLTLSNPG
jgi:hypothetical protein